MIEANLSILPTTDNNVVFDGTKGGTADLYYIVQNMRKCHSIA